MSLRNGSISTAAEARTKIAYKNRWKHVLHNPKIMLIALFASYVSLFYAY